MELQRNHKTDFRNVGPRLRFVVGRLSAILFSIWIASFIRVQGAGVTLVTHGFGGNVDDWVIPMTDAISRNPLFTANRGVDYTCYEFEFVETSPGSGSYILQQQRIGGVHPLESSSGEILIKLNWSRIAGSIFGSTTASTIDIAPVVSSALLNPNFVPELGGIALAELPIHLIGHSRGGSRPSDTQ